MRDLKTSLFNPDITGEEINTVTHVLGSNWLALLEECFARNGNAYLRVVSGSMAPLIAVDDRVLAQKISAKDITVGDIVVFKCKDMLVVHRVVGKFNEDAKLYFIQKGDLSGSTGKVLAENVVGKVVAVEKNGRFLRLDRGWGGVANVLQGMNSYLSYRIATRLNYIKERLRDVPGSRYLKWSYRAFVLPFNLLNRGILRVISNILSS